MYSANESIDSCVWRPIASQQRWSSIELAVVAKPLGREARGGSLEHGTQLDRVAHLVDRELADEKPAGCTDVEEPDVSEPLERHANRSARDAETRRERHLGDPFAARELAAQAATHARR